jgi:hypothetical protein
MPLLKICFGDSFPTPEANNESRAMGTDELTTGEEKNSKFKKKV